MTRERDLVTKRVRERSGVEGGDLMVRSRFGTLMYR